MAGHGVRPAFYQLHTEIALELVLKPAVQGRSESPCVSNVWPPAEPWNLLRDETSEVGDAHIGPLSRQRVAR